MKLRLTTRIMLAFMPLSVLVLSMVGVLAYRSASEGLEAAAISELLTKGSEKQAALNTWLDERMNTMRHIALESDVVEHSSSLMAATPGSRQARIARDSVVEEFEPYVTGKDAVISEIFVMAPNSGKVLASSKPNEEGKQKRGHDYFEHGKKALYLQAPYFSPDTQAPAMTIALPLRAGNGQTVAVLGASLNLADMNRIVQRRTGLRRTEDAYLINAARYPVTQPRFLQAPVVLRTRIETEAARQCVTQHGGVTLAADYRGVPAISVCNWDTRHQLGLIVEIGQDEAFEPARAFGRDLLLILVLAQLATAGMAFWLAHSLSRPLRLLRDKMSSFADEHPQHELSPAAADEVEQLTLEFRHMSARVEDRTAELAAANSALQAEINERKQLEQQALLAASAFASISESILITDAGQKIIFVNAAFVKASGYRPEEVMGRTLSFLQSGRHDAAFYAELWAQMRATDHWQGEVWDRRKDGGEYPVLLSLSTVRNAEGKITHYVGVQSDISSAKRYESQLEYQSRHDTLTGLANRLLFGIRVEAALARARRTGRFLGLIFLDLDRFKSVNDTLGHAIGDALLQKVGERLACCVRATDTVARFGGDEFAILLDLLESSSAAAIVAQKILDTLAMTFHIDGHEISISASIGISMYPEHGSDVDTLMKQADSAMYAAKESGRNSYRFYSPRIPSSVATPEAGNDPG